MVRPRGGLVTDCRVILWALAPIEHAVVPDHAHKTMTQLIGAGARGGHELLSRRPIPPRRQEHQLPLVLDAGENVVVDQVPRIRIEP